MGSVEGLYGKEEFYFPTLSNSVLSNFTFLAVEEVHKLGV
jgi:hypothetical protein